VDRERRVEEDHPGKPPGRRRCGTRDDQPGIAVADQYSGPNVARLEEANEVADVGSQSNPGGRLVGAVAEPRERDRDRLMARLSQGWRHCIPSPGAEPGAGDQHEGRHRGA
jgi:hypothetical protein